MGKGWQVGSHNLVHYTATDAMGLESRQGWMTMMVVTTWASTLFLTNGQQNISFYITLEFQYMPFVLITTMLPEMEHQKYRISIDNN